MVNQNKQREQLIAMRKKALNTPTNTKIIKKCSKCGEKVSISQTAIQIEDGEQIENKIEKYDEIICHICGRDELRKNGIRR